MEEVCDVTIQPIAYGVYYSLASVWIRGAVLSGLAYGSIITLSFFCIQILWRNDGLPHRSLKNWLLIAFVAVMALLSTLIFASNTHTASKNIELPTCVKLEYFPYVLNSLGRLGDVCYIISNWGADALLIWRCMVIYQGCKVPRWLIAAAPVVLFWASIATGIIFLTIHMTGANHLVNGPHGLADLYFGNSGIQSIHSSTTLALNCLVTAMIVGRLAFYRKRVMQVLGKDYASPYTGIIAMVVESQLLVVLFDAVLLIVMFHDEAFSESTLLAYQIVSQIQIFAPLLIIFRVAQGKAWSSDTYEKATIGTAPGKANGTMSALRFSVTATSTLQNASINTKCHNQNAPPGDIV